MAIARVQDGDDQVPILHETLRRAVLWRDLTPGTKLSEEVVASAFGVTRTVVRAALNRLCVDGLVVFERNRGAFVARPDDLAADEIFDARIILGREVAARLAATITPAQLATLQDNIVSHRASFRAGNDRDAVRLAEEFHLLMASMAGNATVSAMMLVLICRSALVLATHRRSKTSEKGINEHEEIIEALRRRDVAGAANVMASHLASVLARARLTDDADASRSLAEILAQHVDAAAMEAARVPVTRQPRRKRA